MVLVLIPITAAIILVNQMSNVNSTKQRKFRYVFEELQLITIWLVKACLLVLYWRILYAHPTPHMLYVVADIRKVQWEPMPGNGIY